MAENVANWPFEKRLESTFNRALPKLGPEAREQIAALINPTSLAIIAGVLVAWVVSHAFGVGEVIDIVLLVVGAFSLGFAVFTGIDHLYDFASGAYNAQQESDLDRAADHLAKAVAILGIQAVLAVLFRGRPNMRAGGRTPFRGAPRTPGLRYRPTVRADPRLGAGNGSTSMWGDIVVSTRGSATDRALVLLHEKVHQFLAPKLYVLRNFRMGGRWDSYTRASLYRYVEEALAETIAQVGVNGMRNFFVGIRFPVGAKYAYLTQGGGFDPRFLGKGVVPEGAALLSQGVVSGFAYALWVANQ